MYNCNLLLVVATVVVLHLSSVQTKQSDQSNFWKSFPPGELLWKLERVTRNTTPPTADGPYQRIADATIPPAALDDTLAATSPGLQKRYDSTNFELHRPEDQFYAPTSHEFNNYDREYEAFVRKYFSDKLAEHEDSSKSDDEEEGEGDEVEKQDEDEGEVESESESDEQAFDDDVNTSSETEPLTQESKPRAQKRKSKSKSKQKCRHVRKHKQNCMICENARNGEKSESCTFSRQSEPQNYAFEKERSYSKQRDSEDNDDDNEDEAPTSQSVEQQTTTSAEEDNVEKSSAEATAPWRTSSSTNMPKDSSTCIQMIRSGRVCYKCVAGDGMTTKCYQLEKSKNNKNEHKKRRPHAKESANKKVQKAQQQQRIYKRTISYSYEKGTNGTAENKAPLGGAAAKATAITSKAKPKMKEKIYIKVVKKMQQ